MYNSCYNTECLILIHVYELKYQNKMYMYSFDGMKAKLYVRECNILRVLKIYIMYSGLHWSIYEKLIKDTSKMQVWFM